MGTTAYYSTNTLTKRDLLKIERDETTDALPRMTVYLINNTVITVEAIVLGEGIEHFHIGQHERFDTTYHNLKVIVYRNEDWDYTVPPIPYHPSFKKMLLRVLDELCAQEINYNTCPQQLFDDIVAKTRIFIQDYEPTEE